MSSNPFATRFIRPGAIPFLFLDGDSAEAIVDRLRSHNWRGQIIGPHGSGKSTLLATLTPLIEAAGRSVLSLKIGPGERKHPPLDPTSLSPTTQIIIDGYEQLSWWSRWKLHHLARVAKAGLLVTAHANVGFPTLYQTKPSEAVAQAVVEQLTEAEGLPIPEAEILAAYHSTGGDIRETLFKLFDVHQQRHSSQTPQ
jgi:energy-coupling factor transporter ATP-binding protein EcfA2